ncbi:hypothetical protein DXG03_000616 [Asterophora parasitica]|uniref:Uncharacterized protein n=1 Tax=Asterophora parasitica TaxID=117018 RepID=A0A9P7G7K5_9AGAR|nr:hypothetical protein DXG03_000616 [Asterophora parasitica]
MWVDELNARLTAALEVEKQRRQEINALTVQLTITKALEKSHKRKIDELDARVTEALTKDANLKELLRQVEINRDEWRRRLDVADSRCKILELEADKHLWEEAKRIREENLARAEEEDVRRKAEIEESARKLRELQAEERRRTKEQKQLAREQAQKEQAQREADEARKEQEVRKKVARKAQETQEQHQRALDEERLQKERKAAPRRQRKRQRAENMRQDPWSIATSVERERCRVRDTIMLYRMGGVWNNDVAATRFAFVVDEFEKVRSFGNIVSQAMKPLWIATKM